MDAQGDVVAHREFDAYGNTLAANGSKQDEFCFWFSSKSLDPETGLYYYGYRYYQPETGRWFSRDPMEEQGGLNLYGFVVNSAPNYVDSDGRISLGVKIHLAKMVADEALKKVPSITKCKKTCSDGCAAAHTGGLTAIAAAAFKENLDCVKLKHPILVGGCLVIVQGLLVYDVLGLKETYDACANACESKPE